MKSINPKRVLKLLFIFIFIFILLTIFLKLFIRLSPRFHYKNSGGPCKIKGSLGISDEVGYIARSCICSGTLTNTNPGSGLWIGLWYYSCGGIGFSFNNIF